jgi:hypothetical protein
MLSMSLPMRTRLPTCLSVGFGDFFVIVKLFRLALGADGIFYVSLNG